MSAQPDLAAALVDALDDEALDRLAALLAPRMPDRHADEWLAPREAAAHLGVSTRRIYDLKSSGKLVADGADGRVPLFTRARLDEYARRTR
jgi:hypothetical protein